MNYTIFKEECQQALDNNEINKRDFLLLTKIALAIAEEDSDIKMSLQVYSDAYNHEIECDCHFIDNWQQKIEKAVKKSYIYHQNVWQGWSDCSIIVTSDSPSKSVRKIISDHNWEQTYKTIAQKRKATTQFGDVVDYITELAKRGKYEKCDGIISHLIHNYDTSILIPEEEMLNDLKEVIDGTTDDFENDTYQYTDNVYRIADKYHTDVINIQSVLEMKIRCFDIDYLCQDGFFDMTPKDYEIIERKLQGKPYDNVKSFKMLSEIDLSR